MPLFSERFQGDGQSTHQILAIEERHDGVKIVVGAPAVGVLALLAGAGGLLFGASLQLLIFWALTASTTQALPPIVRVLQWTGAALCLVVFGLVVVLLRGRINYHSVTVSEGVITLTRGPVWPSRQTLQLRHRDALRVSQRKRGKGWWPFSRCETMREYCICVYESRSKPERELQVIPPFTISKPEATRLAAAMQRHAESALGEAFVGSRL